MKLTERLGRVQESLLKYIGVMTIVVDIAYIVSALKLGNPVDTEWAKTVFGIGVALWGLGMLKAIEINTEK